MEGWSFLFGNIGSQGFCFYFTSGHRDKLGVDMNGVNNGSNEYVPLIRSGGWADIGCRRQMEDTHVIVNDIAAMGGGHGAYYGVFDGHSGEHAAIFVRDHLLRYILEDSSFPSAADHAVRQAFLQTDKAFARACELDERLCSGTTALAVLILGRLVEAISGRAFHHF
ncbi:hypothetical protein L7F22_067458 [Adiantum nelumboides]|nr:hypothetical protein [Adiantum nelumboides]